MTVYYAPTSQIETVDFSLDAGVTILDYFSTLFEVSYPQPNLGILFFFLFERGWVGRLSVTETYRFVNYYCSL